MRAYNRPVTPPDPGNPFPEIELRDERGDRALLPAKETLYAFFKTTCPTCEMAWPFLERIRTIAEGTHFAVLAVSQDEPETTALFNERLGVRALTLYDPPPWRASEALGLDAVPTFFLVGADGRLRDLAVGFQKQKMEEFAERAAGLARRPAEKLFQPGENVPAIKPG